MRNKQPVHLALLVLLIMIGLTWLSPAHTSVTAQGAATPSAATQPATIPAALLPEYILETLGAPVSVFLNPDGTITYTAFTVNQNGIWATVIITVSGQPPYAPSVPSDGKEQAIPKLGDASVAFTTPPSTVGGTHSDIVFVKGNMRVELTVFPLAPGEIPMASVLQMAQPIAAELPATIPEVAIMTWPHDRLDQATYAKYFGQIDVGKLIGSQFSTAATFAPGEYVCMNVKFAQEKPAFHIEYAIYDVQKQIYIYKQIGLSGDEVKSGSICTNATRVPDGKYEIHVWAEQQWVARLPFEIKE